MRVTRHFRIACLLLLLSIPVAGEETPFRWADIVEQREPSSPRISPDGRTVAFLVRQASIATNSNSTSLYVVTPGSPPRKILEENSIAQVEWIPDSQALIAALPRGGKAALWRVPPDGGMPVPLFEHPTRIQQYRWAPDGSRLAFVTSEESTPEERATIENSGVVYDDKIFGIRNFTSRAWSLPKPQQIWLWDARTGRAQRLASMERNLDWFRFWLQGYEDPRADKQEQYARWRGLKEKAAPSRN